MRQVSPWRLGPVPPVPPALYAQVPERDDYDGQRHPTEHDPEQPHRRLRLCPVILTSMIVSGKLMPEPGISRAQREALRLKTQLDQWFGRLKPRLLVEQSA
jgi:hypothetical protein